MAEDCEMSGSFIPEDLLDDTPVRMVPDDESPQATASGLGFARDYNADLTNVSLAWRRTKGSGARVAILDTGMPRHKDIRVTGSRSFVEGCLEDIHGHATAVGSILAGTGAGRPGVTGIAPEADVYYGAVLGPSGAGSMSSVADGIRWAVDEVGADVINLSLGVPHASGLDPRLYKACSYARKQGAAIVAAAGNDASRVNWPAALENVIAVAAVDRGLRTASFSARGPEVEFAAGGVDVTTAYLDNGYAVMSGTSFSAPVISGIVALLVAERRARGLSTTPDEVRDALKLMAYDIGDDGRDEFTGWGIPVFTKDPSAKPSLKIPWWRRLLAWLRI